MLGLQRQIGAPGLQHRQQAHHQLDRPLRAHTHQHVRPHAEASQMAGQAVGVGVERGVAECRGPRTPPRRPPACAEPAPQTATAGSTVQAPAPWRSSPQDGVALRRHRGSTGCPAHAHASATAAASSRIRRRPSTSTRAPLEQVGGVFHNPADPRRRPRRGALLGQPHRQVELRARRGNRLRRHASPASFELRPRALAPPQTPASPGTAGAATATAPD